MTHGNLYDYIIHIVDYEVKNTPNFFTKNYPSKPVIDRKDRFRQSQIDFDKRSFDKRSPSITRSQEIAVACLRAILPRFDLRNLINLSENQGNTVEVVFSQSQIDFDKRIRKSVKNIPYFPLKT